MSGKACTSFKVNDYMDEPTSGWAGATTSYGLEVASSGTVPAERRTAENYCDIHGTNNEVGFDYWATTGLAKDDWCKRGHNRDRRPRSE